MTRIYNNPNHRSYGPVRRLWVMVCGMYGFDHTRLDETFYQEWGFTWDAHVDCMIQQQGYTEEYALKVAMWKILATEMIY